jgi:hypothetical protein
MYMCVSGYGTLIDFALHRWYGFITDAYFTPGHTVVVWVGAISTILVSILW